MATSVTRLIGPWLLAAATALPAIAQQAPCRIGALNANGQMTTAADCVPDALRGQQREIITEHMEDLSPAEQQAVRELGARRAGTAKPAATTPPQGADPATVNAVTRATQGTQQLKDAMRGLMSGEDTAAVKDALTPTEKTREDVRKLLGLPPSALPSDVQCYKHWLPNSGSFAQCFYKGMPFEDALRPK